MPPQPSPELAKLLELIPEYEQRFRAAAERYIALRQQCHLAVKSWEWYSFHHFHLDPGYFLLDEHFRPGRRLRKTPADVDGKSRYGFNSAGDVIVAESHGQFRGKCSEEFWEYGWDRIDGTLFDDHPQKDCIKFSTRLFRGGVAVAFIQYAIHGFKVVSYEWKDGLIHSAQTCTGDTTVAGPPPLEVTDYRVEYREREPVSVTKTVTCDDGSVSNYLIKYGQGGKKKAIFLKPGASSGEKTTAKLDGVVNFIDDLPRLREYFEKRIHSQSKSRDSICAVEIGFRLCQAGFVFLNFDTREKHNRDGEWTNAINRDILEMPHWQEAYESAEEDGASFVLLSGEKLNLPPGAGDEAVAAVFGEALIAIVLDRIADGALAPLNLKEDCQLDSEEFDGMWAWPVSYDDVGRTNVIRKLRPKRLPR